MQFLIYHGRNAPMNRLDYPYVSLYQDNWNDFGWRCRFLATLHRGEDQLIELGPLRISADGHEFHLQGLPTVLDKLPARSASLGESIAYYRRLRDLPRKLRSAYVTAIRDIVARPSRREPIGEGDLWNKCFMRDASSRHAWKRGGYYIGTRFEEVEPPRFDFTMQLTGAARAHELSFDFSEHNDLPNRTMLLIGRNGTGKTRALSALAFAAVSAEVFHKETRETMPPTTIEPAPDIARVIAISYNAFDEFPLPREPTKRAPRAIGTAYRSRGSYKYCGLRTTGGEVSVAEVGRMLSEALEPVAQGERTDVLERVLSTLLDPTRAQALTSGDDEIRDAAVTALSAGQRLVVAIFSNIVGFIEEGSLLLIDEPETNLHPGLLTTVIAALNETLIEFDSYAIVASHSPILLQQVPSRFVRVFSRDAGNVPRIEQLSFESFGEDLGELTRRVLGLADPERDFTDVLGELHRKHGSAEAVEGLFPYPLGVPARAHLYALDEAGDVGEQS
jgi:predicted ATPase